MKTKSYFSPKRILIIAAMLFTSLPFTHAQTFIGGGGNDFWSNANNWLDGLKPDGMFSEATISANVVVDEVVSIGTLNNSGNYSLTILTGKRMAIHSELDWGNGDFILEDKAQLVYRDPIKVIVKKQISAYDADNHLWNLIAIPVREDVIPSTENGILTDPESGYALLSFDDSAADWIDYKETPFTLENGKSYLYANAMDTTLVFEGTTKGYSAELPLSYHAANEALAGCNFIGNPLPCNAFLNRSYYIFSEESNSLIAVPNSATRCIAPCTGIIINANSQEDASVLFNEMPFFDNLSLNGTIEITVAKSNAPSLVLDQAILSFNPDDNLGKLSFFEDAPSVYFTKDSKDLAILSIDSTQMQPLRFKARENGSYTIHFELEHLNPNYLHLIDNMTGNNIDLLTTTSYTFDANTGDYTSRFKLVFDPHYSVDEQQNEAFAYYDNGNIIINDVETCHGASLQIVDMTGRVVRVCTDVARNVSTDGMAPGIYVLRLKTQSKVLTQKVMIP